MKRISFKDSGGLNLTQAVLSGRKTQTRRLVPENAVEAYYEDLERASNVYHCGGNCPAYVSPEHDYFLYYAKYKVSEVVAIAQSYKDVCDKSCDPRVFPNGAGWDNKMFVKAELMPHHIRITDVRVERLQDISDEDCLREGVLPIWDNETEPRKIDCYDFTGSDYVYETARTAFSRLIDKVSGRGTWNSNPLVFCYSFKLID